MLPSLLLIGLFSYYPAVRSLVGGFYIWDGFSAPRYDGFGQFTQYFHSSTFGAEARNLVLLVIGSIAIRWCHSSSRPRWWPTCRAGRAPSPSTC